MLLKEHKISRPKTTKIQPRNGHRYVYQVVSSVYNPEKKYNVDKRVCIGKMIDDELMIPNDKFSQFYPELLAETKELASQSDSLKVGGFAIIDKVMDELGLSSIIDEVFEDKALSVKDIVAYMILNNTAVYQHFPSFMFNHPSFEKTVRSDSYISKLLSTVSSADISHFNRLWGEKNADVKDIYIQYDSTNMNSSSEGIELVEFGHAKDDDDKPQINVGMAINANDSTPLFYDLYPGSIVDNSQCKYMVDLAKEFGYHNAGFILDRGYFSKGNLRYFKKHKYDYIMMIKANNVSAKEVIQTVRSDLRNRNDLFIPQHAVFGITVKAKLYATDKEDHCFHVYYDVNRAEAQRVELLIRYSELEQELEKHVADKICTADDLTKYKKIFNLKYDDNGYFKGYQRNEKYIKEQTDKLGFFVIVSTQEMSAGRALDVYRDRDGVEKVFRALKTELGCNAFGVHSDASLKTKVQFAFIASIVRNKIFQGLKPLVKIDRKNFTVNASLNEVENIEVTKNSHGVYVRRYALTARQKKVLAAFGFDEKMLTQWLKGQI